MTTAPRSPRPPHEDRSPLHGRALVTGGTAGLGWSFAQALAARGCDLVLVARDTARLAERAEDLRARFGVDCETITADLAGAEGVAAVRERLESSEQPVEVFVNNAGHGLHHKLTDPDVAPHEAAIDLMVRTVLVLGGTAGRVMAERGHGVIINLSSVAGLVPMGNYSAIKAWVRLWSESLSIQLEGTGVQVMTLLPGWVRTEFHERAHIRTSGLPDIVWLQPDDVVRECLADVDKGRGMSTPSVKFKAISFFARHMPRSLVREAVRRINGDRDKGLPKPVKPHMPHLSVPGSVSVRVPDRVRDAVTDHVPTSLRERFTKEVRDGASDPTEADQH